MGGHLLIERPGLFSSLQDFGRFGYQHFGISASGAMDTVAMQAANALVGNAPGTAVIEMTMLGLAATVKAERCRLALAGADMPLAINGRPVEGWRAHELKDGDRIEIGGAKSGMRGYLAIAGGLDRRADARQPLHPFALRHWRAGRTGVAARRPAAAEGCAGRAIAGAAARASAVEHRAPSASCSDRRTTISRPPASPPSSPRTTG